MSNRKLIYLICLCLLAGAALFWGVQNLFRAHNSNSPMTADLLAQGLGIKYWALLGKFPPDQAVSLHLEIMKGQENIHSMRIADLPELQTPCILFFKIKNDNYQFSLVSQNGMTGWQVDKSIFNPVFYLFNPAKELSLNEYLIKGAEAKISNDFSRLNPEEWGMRLSIRKNKPTLRMHAIDSSFNNSNYTIKSGDVLRILLPSELPGYRWELDKSLKNYNVLEFMTKGYFINGDPSTPYSSPQEAEYLTFIFQAVKAGEHMVIINCLDADNKIARTMKVNVKVD